MPTPSAPSTERPLKRTKIGTVVSDRRDKTRTVAVAYQTRHSKYGKYLRREAKYHVHDEQNQSKAGDVVEIASCRPLSKTKSFRLVRVLEAAPPPVTHQTTAAAEASAGDAGEAAGA